MMQSFFGLPMLIRAIVGLLVLVPSLIGGVALIRRDAGLTARAVCVSEHRVAALEAEREALLGDRRARDEVLAERAREIVIWRKLTEERETENADLREAAARLPGALDAVWRIDDPWWVRQARSGGASAAGGGRR